MIDLHDTADIAVGPMPWRETIDPGSAPWVHMHGTLKATAA